MEKFSINTILSRYNPDVEELSSILFPHVKYPKMAFDRIVRGEANLDSAQLELLASFLGITVQEMFSTLDSGWKASANNSLLIFKKGDYTVKLNYKGSFITLLYNADVIYKGIINSPGMSIEDFINYIDSLIKSNKDGRN